jgi:hypothetical protein
MDTLHHHSSLVRICVLEWSIHIRSPRVNLRIGMSLQEPLRVQNGPGLTAALTNCLPWSTHAHGLNRTGNLLSVAFSEVAWRSRWLIDFAHLVAEDAVDDSQPPFPVDYSTSPNVMIQPVNCTAYVGPVLRAFSVRRPFL